MAGFLHSFLYLLCIVDLRGVVSLTVLRIHVITALEKLKCTGENLLRTFRARTADLIEVLRPTAKYDDDLDRPFVGDTAYDVADAGAIRKTKRRTVPMQATAF